MTTSKKTPKKAKPKADQKSARGRGRPTDYKAEYDDQAKGFCLLGATNDKLAELFEVSVSSIEYWIRNIPSFSRSVKEGREVADTAVAQSLYGKAMSGDVTACIFWLKNRKPENWREKQEHTLSNPDGGPIALTVRFVKAGGK